MRKYIDLSPKQMLQIYWSLYRNLAHSLLYQVSYLKRGCEAAGAHLSHTIKSKMTAPCLCVCVCVCVCVCLSVTSYARVCTDTVRGRGRGPPKAAPDAKK